jgi:hypothetical protein
MDVFLSEHRHTERLLSEHAEYFDAKAAELLRGGETILRTSMGAIEWRLIRFWNGGVLESIGPDAARSGSRIDRRVLRRDPLPRIRWSLAHAVAGLGPEVTPT